jgi:O-antigen ligase
MISISPNTVTGHLGAYGTLWEPNVFGAFCAAGAIAWAWLGPRYFRFTWIGIAACLAGTLVSYTRAAWAVVIVVLAISLLGKVRQRANLRQVAFGLIAAAVIALAALGAERTTSYYVPVPGQPPSQTTNQGIFALLLNSIDVLGRLDQVKIGGSEIRSHLILGNGTASFGVRHLNQGQPEHLANLELTLLYDTGIVGLLVFLGFMGTIAYAAWRRRDDPFVAGLGMSTLVIFLTNIATETTELMITWLLVGLLMMAVDVASPASEQALPRTVRAA